MIEDLAIFGICGWSGSGKTTLIEKLAARLCAEGLRVAVAKHDAHGIAMDPAGKDSDLLFRAGADVFLSAPGGELIRLHAPGGEAGEAAWRSLAARYDLVLVEGHKRLPFTKVWLLRDGDSGPPEGIEGIAIILGREADREAEVLPVIRDFLHSRWLARPLYGCVLFGGESRRMGTAKHLLPVEGGSETWLERTVRLLERRCRRVVIAGRGEIPAALSGHPRLEDIPGAEGPLAGVLAAMRWNPEACCLVAACDLPGLTDEALEWILAQRRPGVWVVLPRIEGTDRVEPLLAGYDVRSRAILEDLVLSGRFGLKSLAGHARVRVFTVPPHLAGAWGDVDTPEGLARQRAAGQG